VIMYHVPRRDRSYSIALSQRQGVYVYI